jgi:hypothetical protein
VTVTECEATDEDGEFCANKPKYKTKRGGRLICESCVRGLVDDGDFHGEKWTEDDFEEVTP